MGLIDVGCGLIGVCVLGLASDMLASDMLASDNTSLSRARSPSQLVGVDVDVSAVNGNKEPGRACQGVENESCEHVPES